MYNFLVWHVLSPFTLLLLLLLLTITRLWLRRRETRRRLLWVTVPFLLLFFLSTPSGANLVVGTLEDKYPPPAEAPPAGTEVIVLLGSSYRIPDPETKKPELDEDSLYRCLHAADLYRARACPIVVCGGKPDPEEDVPAVAEVMRDFLVQLGVKPDDVLVETRSQNTYENAVECRKILKERGWRKVVLVTDAVDLHRALRCFAKQGVEATPSGCHDRAGPFGVSLASLVPNPKAARNSQRAFHEWLGLAWYWIKGRI